jgi:hypothetical protein
VLLEVLGRHPMGERAYSRGPEIPRSLRRRERGWFN